MRVEARAAAGPGPGARVRPGTEALPRRADLPRAGARVHLMGVAGAGMRGLGLVLAEMGFRVSGCDRSGAPVPELARRGIPIHGEHAPEHVAGCELLVRSSAIPEDHREVEAARRAGVPVEKRARVLGATVNDRRLVAVAGTHGKTTITAMAACALEAGGMDPVALVGGRVPGWGAYARAGQGDVAVAEADEFDRSFLELDPSLVVVSSVEPEHVESFGSFGAVEAAYRELAGRGAGRDGVLFCADDPGATAACGNLRDAAGYGFAPEAAYRLEEVAGGDGWRLRGPEGSVPFTLRVPGRHNVQNAGAALAAALRLGAGPAALEGALEAFPGVERRLQVLAETPAAVVVDDYAHHPTELRASLSALRDRYADRRLLVVFQPHLYTRTRDFAGELAQALAAADRAVVLPVFPAREDPIPGVTSELIVDAAADRDRISLEPRETVARPGWSRRVIGDVPTVLVFMGAGDVTELARAAARELAGGEA